MIIIKNNPTKDYKPIQRMVDGKLKDVPMIIKRNEDKFTGKVVYEINFNGKEQGLLSNKLLNDYIDKNKNKNDSKSKRLVARAKLNIYSLSEIKRLEQEEITESNKLKNDDGFIEK